MYPYSAIHRLSVWLTISIVVLTGYMLILFDLL